MDFLIPNKIQDTLLCKVCHKFLSVQLVKMYKDGLIKCGRCSDSRDEGVISLYNQIAAKSVFSCVNRFDGCKELLTSDDVLQHELKCLPECFVCPLCLFYEEVPTYLMIKHFKENHTSAFLESNILEINEFDGSKTYFLYRLKNNLFFLLFENKCFETLDLIELNFNCMILSKQDLSNNFTTKFSFAFDNSCEKKEIPCGNYASLKGSGGCITLKRTSSINLNIIVNFDIQSQTNELIKLPIQKRKIGFGQTSTEIKNPKNLRVCIKTAYFQKRHIIVNERAARGAHITLSPDSTGLYMLNKKASLNLYCLNCSELNFIINNDRMCLIKRPNNQFYSICIPCIWIVHKKFDLSVIVNKEFLEEISFFCKWQCGVHLGFNFIKQHESTCMSQPGLKCPVAACSVICRVNELLPHFIQNHTQKLIIMFNSEDLILQTNQCETEYFFVVFNVFIHAKFVWRQPFWLITLKCDVDDMEPRAVILNEENKLIVFIKTSGLFLHRSKIKIKCYAVDPEKECHYKPIHRGSISTNSLGGQTSGTQS